MAGKLITMRDDKGFERMYTLVDEIKGHAEVGDVDSLESAVEELGSLLGELQDFIDYASEASRG
jgi:soluble cytochrome b562